MLPNILIDLGLSQSQIEQLFQDHLKAYLDQITLYLCDTCSGSSDEQRRHDMMLRYYGLKDTGRETLGQIGKDYNLSAERVRQLILLRFQTMRQPVHQQALRNYLKQAALDILNPF